MLIEEVGGRGRKALQWVSFEDCHNGVSGYATGWYFLVHSSFKAALDIFYVERIDAEKTKKLRDKVSLELTGLPHKEFKKRIKASGRDLAHIPEHQEILKHSFKLILETQGDFPMQFSFRATDGFESRNGEWYIQIESAVAATKVSRGEVGFVLYERNRHPDSGLAWERMQRIETTQEEFVELLRCGYCRSVSLLNMRQRQLI